MVKAKNVNDCVIKKDFEVPWPHMTQREVVLETLLRRKGNWPTKKRILRISTPS